MSTVLSTVLEWSFFSFFMLSAAVEDGELCLFDALVMVMSDPSVYLESLFVTSEY